MKPLLKRLINNAVTSIFAVLGYILYQYYFG